MIVIRKAGGAADMIRSSRSRGPVLAALVLAGLLVFVLPAASVGAAPIPTASADTSAASYGAVRTIVVPPTTASNGWMYQGSVTFGFAVTIFDNSTGPSTFELTMLRTMGVQYTVQFCDPSCGSPTQWANQSFRVYETTTTFANFTSQGTVLQNGTSEVAAIALENSTTYLHANLTESSDIYLPLLGELGPHLRYLGANLFGQSSVTFSPALGLFPVNLSPGSTWSSTSSFTAVGSASYDYFYAAHAPIKTVIIGPVSGGGSLSTSGNVAVAGAYPAGSTFQFGGQTYPAITLVITGPFDVREGIIFIPTTVDLFGSVSQPWAGNATGTATAQMANLDIKAGSGAHFQFVASSWKYASSTENAATATSVVPASSNLAPAATNSNQLPPGTVQGLPVSSPQVSSDQNCLITGSGCPGSSSGPSPHSLLGLAVIAGVVVVAAVLIAVGIVSRRRNAPPPVYPNAVLYPPGAATPSAPGRPPAGPGTPSAPEEDPLDHLW